MAEIASSKWRDELLRVKKRSRKGRLRIG